MDYRQQLQHVCRVVPLGHRQLAAFVSHRVLVADVVRLRQDFADTAKPLASVVSTARRLESNVRSTSAVERATFSASKLACAADDHANFAVGLPSAVSGAATSECHPPLQICGSSWPSL